MPKKILIVDDEPDIVKITSVRVRKAGYDVITAINGEEALEVIRSQKPDLVFLDIRIPGLNGLEVCERIKSEEGVKHIPVILFTASAEAVQEKVKEVGASGFLIKPFDSNELLDKIKQLIGS